MISMQFHFDSFDSNSMIQNFKPLSGLRPPPSASVIVFESNAWRDGRAGESGRRCSTLLNNLSRLGVKSSTAAAQYYLIGCAILVGGHIQAGCSIIVKHHRVMTAITPTRNASIVILISWFR